MKKAKFGMVWQVYGLQTIDIPDEYAKNEDDAEWYIRTHWDEIPVPDDGTYIGYSDELDDTLPIEICDI